MSARATAAVVLAALVLLVPAGCGGDDDEKDKQAGGAGAGRTETTGTATGETAPRATETERARTGQDSGGAKAPRGEDQPGGAGDEIPNTTQALITGRAGKLSPATVSVPPFIAITVELRSADGRDYSLRGGGKALAAGEGQNSDTVSFAGLRPGRKLVLGGPQGRVTVTANAEPGP